MARGPLNLRVTKNYRGRIYVEWDEVDSDDEIPEYCVTISEVVESEPRPIKKERTSQSQYKLPNIYVGPEYEVKVGYQEEVATLTVRAATETAPPDELRRTDGNGRIHLDWTKPTFTGGTVITSYEIYLRDTSSEYKHVGTVGPETTTYDITKEAGHKYTVAVFAKNASGRSLTPAVAGEEGAPSDDEPPIEPDEHNMEIKKLKDDDLSDIEGYISLSAALEEDRRELADSLGCPAKTESGEDMIRWITAQGYSTDVLDNVFRDLHIVPKLGEFLEYKRGKAKTVSAEGSGLKKVQTEDRQIESRGDRVKEIAKQALAAEVLVNAFEISKNGLVIYYEPGTGQHVPSAESKLKNIIQNMPGKIDIKPGNMPKIETTSGPVGIGNTLRVGQNTAKVGGLLIDENKNKCCLSVGHLFNTQSTGDPCILQTKNHNHCGKLLAKDVDLDGSFLRQTGKLYIDVSVVELLEWPANINDISNVFHLAADMGVRLKLRPVLFRSVPEFDSLVDTPLYICPTSRQNNAMQGVVEYAGYTGHGDPNFFAMTFPNGQILRGDSGRLVTSADTKNKCRVEVIGMIVGADANGLSVVLPLWPQLQHLCTHCAQNSPIYKKEPFLEFIDT